MVTKGEMCGGGRDKPGAWNEHTYTTKYVRQIANKGLLYSTEDSTLFCDNLYGKIMLKRMNICICITESFCSTPESNTAL